MKSRTPKSTRMRVPHLQRRSIALKVGYFVSIAFYSLLFSFLSHPAHSQSTQPLVDRIEIRDTIQPITAGRLTHAIDQASRDHAALSGSISAGVAGR